MSISVIVALFFSFIALLLVFLVAKKVYYRVKLKKVFHVIPRIGTLGIASVGMILSLSVSVILLLIICTAGVASLVFRLWAGIRIVFEGILIKIGGMMFGPIIGMFLGAAVDILTIAYTGGIFHYGYFISAILFGLFGGIIRMLLTSSKSHDLRFSLFSTLFTFVIIAMSSLLIWFTNKDSINNEYDISFFGISFGISLSNIIVIVTTIPLAGLVILWTCYFVNRYQMKKNQNAKNWFKTFAPVFVVIMITEIIVNVIFMPVFDATLSPLTYQVWLTIRLLLLVPMVILNMVIILPVYKIVNPLMRYNYENELVTDIEPKTKNKHIKKSNEVKEKV